MDTTQNTPIHHETLLHYPQACDVQEGGGTYKINAVKIGVRESRLSRTPRFFYGRELQPMPGRNFFPSF